MGADHFVNSRDPEAIKALANHFDVILSTVNVNLDWEAYVAALRPRGRLHFVGAVTAPIAVQFFSLIMNKSVSATPLGSPATIKKMLEFTTRHQTEPRVELFPFAQVNEAIEKLRHGQPRYRIVLKQT